eukprot:jgi/Psemu1/200166/e_gw1.252.8.1
MSANDSDDTPTGSSTKGQRCRYYQQLGAPTLIYEGCRHDHHSFRAGSKNMPIDKAKDVYETIQRRNRAKARWQYSLDIDQMDSVLVPRVAHRKRIQENAEAKPFCEDGGSSSDSEIESESNERLGRQTKTLWVDQKQQQNRLAMLLEDDRRIIRHRECLQNHARYEHPYVKTKCIRCDQKKKQRRTDPETHLKSQQLFSSTLKVNSDPSYLASFDLDSINDVLKDRGARTNSKGRYDGYRRKIPFNDPHEGLSQGNALLTVPCPCHSCSRSGQGYILLHPKGDCLERLCVSSLIPPLGQSNDGDIDNENNRAQLNGDSVASQLNEICLDDNILEIRQCGTWHGNTPECLLSVRTGTHISLVNVRCKTFEWKTQQQCDIGTPECCGCYVLREIERLDLRSFSPKLPSFRPISLASHPRYGNAFTPSRFAFVSQSTGSSVSTFYNVIHSCVVAGERVTANRHDINNLRSITLIDFSNQNPMCLWSAASSYIRPALAPGTMSKMNRLAKSPFGLGSSLFTIDLRHNSAAFQWSPSAEEMMTEGVHSINGISTDWTRENVVFVTSSSAGKTWEIDGRMPCRAVNTWSLTSICEEYRSITLPEKSFHGKPSLLTRPIALRSAIGDERSNSNDNPDPPIIKVDTDSRANGIHLFQKPLRKPRFQTDSLECIGTAGLDATDTASIATSSYFDLIDVSEDTFTCGVSSIRLPLSQFVGLEENIWPQYRKQKLNVLCTLTMKNNGDIYSHSNGDNLDGNILLNNSKKKKIDEGTAVIQIKKKPRKPGLVISTEGSNCNRNEMIKRDGDDRTLIMPISHSKGMQRNTMVYAGRNGYDSDDSHGIAGVGINATERVRRSDLSQEIIQNTLEKWEDTASEQESSDESY